MRVVSQGKDISVDFDRFPFWIRGTCIFTSIDGDSQMIGAYKSVDRVNEVFMDMHNAYIPELIQIPETEQGASWGGMSITLTNQANATTAAQMVPNAEGCVQNGNCVIYCMPEE